MMKLVLRFNTLGTSTSGEDQEIYELPTYGLPNLLIGK